LLTSTNHKVPRWAICSGLLSFPPYLCPNAFLSTLFSKTFTCSLCSSLNIRDRFFHSSRPVQVVGHTDHSLTCWVFNGRSCQV